MLLKNAYLYSWGYRESNPVPVLLGVKHPSHNNTLKTPSYRQHGWREGAGTPPCRHLPKLTLHLKGLTGRCTIMWVLRVCFWMKLLKQTWHWKGRMLLWISMWRFRLADSVNSREHTSHLCPFIPWGGNPEMTSGWVLWFINSTSAVTLTVTSIFPHIYILHLHFLLTRCIKYISNCIY